jgi:putative peptide zinc metalloprotease protein
MTKLKLLLLSLLAALAIAGVAHAATFSSAKTNAARAEALTTPKDSVFDLALGYRENDTDTVDEANSAFAHSTCDGCRTVAIAFQVVIVQSRPSTVVPENVALALNEECNGCSSLALAYQFVVGKGEPARITSRGQKQLFAVGDDLLRLERSYKDLTDAEIKAHADADEAKVRSILSTELVPIQDGGHKPSFEDHREVRRAAA